MTDLVVLSQTELQAAFEQISEQRYSGHQNPNTFDDGKHAAVEAVNALINLSKANALVNDTEPVRYERQNENGDWVIVEKSDCEYYRNKGQPIRPLFTYQVSTVRMPDHLHPDTQILITQFSQAMATKLRKSELKYGYTNLWNQPRFIAGMRESLLAHLEKGDPIDVAAFCMFLWFHNELTCSGDKDNATV